MSRHELENLTRRYTVEITPMIGPDRDIPAPDMGTNPQVMAWMMDTYSMAHGYTIPAVVTGKPVSVGGSEGRYDATGRGMLYILDEHLRDEGGLADRTVAVHGFGNVGGVAARLLRQAGARVRYICDRWTGLYHPDGIDVRSAFAHVEGGGTLADWRGEGEQIEPEEVLYGDVDILVPASAACVVDGSNADRVRARLIVEGANGPLTPEADQVFRERSVGVIPDIVANAGGVTVSYFEWGAGTSVSALARGAGPRGTAPPDDRRLPRGDRALPDRRRLLDARGRAVDRHRTRRRGDGAPRDLPVVRGRGAPGASRGSAC